MAIAIGTAIALGVAAASAGSGVYAAKKQSESADKAADLTTTTANHAADLQSKSAADALAFQKQQAQNAFQNEESARRANYDLFASGERRKQSVNDLLGMGKRDIPDYVPGVDPHLTGGAPASAVQSVGSLAAAPAGTQGAAAPANGDWQGWFNSLVAGKPYNQQTLLDLEPTLNAAGAQLTPPNAAGDRTKINFPGLGWVRVGFGEGKPVFIPQSAGQVAPGAANVGSVGSYLQPQYARPVTAALSIPKPVGSYL